MIKRIFSIFIVFIVSLTSVYAEDLNNYDSLEVQVKVNGELQVVRESSSYSLEYISSELSFFPKNDEFQEVKDEKIISIPNAKIKKGDTINYRWEDYNLETLTSEASQSSVWVLENKKGVCDELTTLFVAMLRSKGIPARFVTGSSYTNVINDFGNHAWAEIYFPNVGWVAFDPTYGQLGYVDAAHIKMKESVDIKNSSVNYAWRSRNINLNPKEMSIDVEVISKEKLVSYDNEISLDLLKNQVGPGSKVPLNVTVKNNENFYLPLMVYLTKGPSEVKKNSIELLLKPNSNESVLFLVDIPKDLRTGFAYESVLEVKDSYGHNQSIKLEYGENYDVYTNEGTESKAERLEEETTNNVELICNPSHETYYINEGQCEIHCIIKNKDEASFFDLKVLNGPNVDLINLDYPHTINYNENAEIKFSLSSNTDVKSVYTKIGNKDVFSQETLKFNSDFVVPFNGDFFYYNEPVIEITYKDMNGKDYSVKEDLSILVVDAPWYAWIAKLLRF